MAQSQGGQAVSDTSRLVDQILLSEKNDYVHDNQETKIRELRERINRLERLAEELAYEDCASSRKDIWQGFKEAQ
jgi:phage portal protein BeeE